MRVGVWTRLGLLGLLACGTPKSAQQPKPEVDAGRPPSGGGPVADSGVEPVQAAPKAPKEPPYRLFAKRFVVKVREAPSKEAFRLGYMRAGSILMSKTGEPVGHEKCRKGWYELETGGFVCSTVDLIPFRGKRLPERRAAQPDRNGRLPYAYGYSRRNNTPVFRRLPTDEEAAIFEGYRIPGRPPLDGGLAAPASVATGSDPGAALTGLTPVVPAPRAAGTPGEGVGDEAQEQPKPTLESLMGDDDSVLLRRMERGFYVSLDREMKKGARRYWRTQANGFIPHKRLLLVDGTDFHGVHFPQDGRELPIGYLMSSKHFAYELTDKGRLRRSGKPGYHHLFEITGTTELRGRQYYTAKDGKLYRAKDARRIDRRPKPQEVAQDERWIDVDLSSQSLVAYLGEEPVFATLISSGRVKREDDPLRNFATPTGAFRLTSKHLTATMDGDHAIDGPYSIEDVPYVMYFQLAYALHSAFWHNSFGRPRSHGCINLAPDDARWVFNFAVPDLPAGWHGVYPTERKPATRLYIRGETPKG